MLQLEIFPPVFGEPSASPFCLKAMCFLTLAEKALLDLSGPAFSWRADFSADPRKAPKQKLPVLKDGERLIPDSENIRFYLEQKYGVDFDAGLSTKERVCSRAFIRLADEHLGFALLSERWLNDENWAQVRDNFFGGVPFLLRGLVSKAVRKKVVNQAYAQGMGRFSEQERADRVALDLAAIKAQVGGTGFLFGEMPTAADASVVPFLNSIRILGAETPLKALVAKDADLVAYAERGRKAMYPADPERP